ncbi:MAG: hypothetical protein M0R17_03005 [Candidatus Omnitrophica bacterium]|jgi:hypothetical protein|nr:hypothetical protein [Candidatus Omnitrophota bacterium]
MINIERTLETGYEDKEYETSEALNILNIELSNGRSIWLDNCLFNGDMISETEIARCKKVCVTNKLIGG